MHLRPALRFAPMRWLREAAPIKLKLNIAFGVCTALTALGIALGWWGFTQVKPASAADAVRLARVENLLFVGRIGVMATTLLTGFIFARLIADPYVTIVRRMEGLAEGDLDSPIPFIGHTDCVGRIAKAMFIFRDTAIAQLKTTELNRSQSLALWSANAKLERLARHLSRALEEARHASEAKSRFLAGMSHELRTPLNGLLGYARLLRLEGALTQAQDERVCGMLVAGAHLLDTINRVLDISEIESDRAELKPAVTEVLPTAKACLDMVRPSAANKGLVLKLISHRDTPAQFVTDATRLRQVMLNLLGNAVKFTASGKVEMRLGPARASPDGLRVEVLDTGPGIPPALRSHLFQEFERLDPAMSGRVEGAGLGLALSQRLTRMLGGTIGYEDNPRGGSIFWLELPPLSAAVDDPDQAKCIPDPATASPLRVLVVDDLAMNREIARAFLSAAGHEVACAEGGAEAVDQVARYDFDVVVMDVRMPEMDGLEATRRIRALEAPRGKVPIVAMTAQAFAEQIRECRAAGMNLHVTKPFAPEELTQAVALAALGPRAEMQPPPGGPHALQASPVVPQPTEVLPAEFDESLFAQTASVLPPDVLKSFLQTMADRGKTLREGISQADSQSRCFDDLADLAHVLAGSAGMFGFRRLAAAARRYEYAVQNHDNDTGALASELGRATDQAMEVVGSKLRLSGAGPTETAEIDAIRGVPIRVRSAAT
jgi:signal transduction histidine kinase/DNA-binding NarL/FixJ family response regulator/HPt (histidine-containing phosphotransfer) domain-containing protein